jgi:hypothetical protein
MHFTFMLECQITDRDKATPEHGGCSNHHQQPYNLEEESGLSGWKPGWDLVFPSTGALRGVNKPKSILIL